jgi:hypothetical protein
MEQNSTWPGKNLARRAGILVKSERLPWFLFASLLIHAFLMWRFSFVPFWSSSSYPIVIVTGLELEAPALTPEGAGRRATRPSRADSAGQPQRASSKAIDAPPSTQNDSFTASERASQRGEGSPGLGNVLSEGTGLGIGGIGSPRSGTPSETGSGTGTRESKSGLSDGKSAVPAADRFVIAISQAIQRTTSPYESEVYAQVDFYTLFTPDFRRSVNVPGNQICLENGTIRTIERQIIKETLTDISKCRYDNMGDDQEKMRCPSEAHTTVVSYDNYLSSPVSYTVNVCLLYDKSNCYWNYPDDGPEREVCRAAGEYLGIWAHGTMFQYKCTKSASQAYTHPLEYEVRFLQDVEFPEHGLRRRLVQREKRPVLRCQ